MISFYDDEHEGEEEDVNVHRIQGRRISTVEVLSSSVGVGAWVQSPAIPMVRSL